MLATVAEMNGFAAGSQLRASERPFVAGSFALLRERVAAFGGPPPDSTAADGTSGEAAYFRELLGAHGEYSHESTTVVPLSTSLLALPSGDVEPIPAFIGEAAGSSLAAEQFRDRFLLPTSEVARRQERSGFAATIRGSDAVRFKAAVRGL